MFSEEIKNTVEFDKNSNNFIVNNELNSLKVTFPFNYCDDSDSYEVISFQNNLLNNESDIFSIYLKKGFYKYVNKDSDSMKKDYSVGIIIPVNALVSLDHDSSEINYFIKHSYGAYKYILERLSPLEKFIEKDLVDLTELVDERILLLVLSRNKLLNLKDFNINAYLPSLGLYGYYRYKKGNELGDCISNNMKELYKSRLNINNQGRIKNIKLRCLNDKYYHNDYLSYLYSSLLGENEYSFMRFNYLYQCIELLIEDCYKVKFNKYLEEFGNNNLSVNDFREKLLSLNEVNRIITIKEENKPNNVICEELNKACNSLLEKVSETKDNVAKSLYQVRNKIVHNSRDIINIYNHEEYLEKINYWFEQFVNELITSRN